MSTMTNIITTSGILQLALLAGCNNIASSVLTAAEPASLTPKIKITDENDQTISYASDAGSKVSSQPTLDTIEIAGGDTRGNSHLEDDIAGPSGTVTALSNERADSIQSYDTIHDEYAFPDPSTLTFRSLNRSDEEDDSFCEEKEIEHRGGGLSRWDASSYDPNDLSQKFRKDSDISNQRKKSLTWSDDFPIDAIETVSNKENGGTNITKDKDSKKNGSDKQSKSKNRRESSPSGSHKKSAPSEPPGRKSSNTSQNSSRRSSCIETSAVRKVNSHPHVHRKSSYSYDSRHTNYNWENEKNEKKKNNMVDANKKNKNMAHCNETSKLQDPAAELLVRKTGRSFSSAKDSRRCNRGGGDDQEEESLLGFHMPMDVTLSSIINHIAYMNQAGGDNSKISSKLKESKKRQIKQVLFVAYLTAMMGVLLSISMIVYLGVEIGYRELKPISSHEKVVTHITPTWVWLLLRTFCRGFELLMGCTMANITRQPVNKPPHVAGYNRRMSTRNSLYL